MRRPLDRTGTRFTLPLWCLLLLLVGALLSPAPATAATAEFRASATTVRAGEAVVFDASPSSGVAPLTYTWDFGDDEGEQTSEPSISHTWAEPGVYTVHLEVEDDDYDYASAEQTITVLDEFGASEPPWAQETSRSEQVVAGLFYRQRDYRFDRMRLKIARAGVTTVDVPLRRLCRYCTVSPAGFGRDSSIRVRDLDADGEPEVLVDLFTGGAHCCFYTEVYRHTGDGRYAAQRKTWGNVSYRLRDLDDDGAPEFVTADDRFAYAFSCFACSGLPVRILRFTADRAWRDVTAAHPALVRRDAARWRRLYRREARRDSGDGRGYLAAYVADLYRLGEHRTARRVLRTALRRGHLTGDGWPQGRRYITVLRERLRRWGY